MRETTWIRRFLRPRFGRIAAGVVLAAAAVLGGLVAAGRGGSADPARIVVTETACAPGWVAPRSGRTVFTVENATTYSTYEIDLIGGNQVSVYGEIEELAPKTTGTMDVVLPPGRYSFECESYAGAELSSQPALVTGPRVAGAHTMTPVTSNQLLLATVAYRNGLAPTMKRLERDTDALTRAVAARRLGAARALWLPAHLDYERLGAVYGTFGALDAAINGRPLGLRGGVRDPHFHGFLRLEYGLWHGQPSGELVPVVNRLDRDVHTLVKRFPHLRTPNTDLALRTHEILENMLQFELTGETDEGSHSNLATAWANVQGTQRAIAALAPLLSVSSPGLAASAKSGLVHLAAAFKSYERPNGTWRSLGSLTTTQRERLDGETSALLERLSLVPDRLELSRQPPSDNDGHDG
jgi:high-affinity iron transporter